MFDYYRIRIHRHSTTKSTYSDMATSMNVADVDWESDVVNLGWFLADEKVGAGVYLASNILQASGSGRFYWYTATEEAEICEQNWKGTWRTSLQGMVVAVKPAGARTIRISNWGGDNEATTFQFTHSDCGNDLNQASEYWIREGELEFDWTPDKGEPIHVSVADADTRGKHDWTIEFLPMYSAVDLRLRCFIPSEVVAVDQDIGPIFSGDNRDFDYEVGTDRAIQYAWVTVAEPWPQGVLPENLSAGEFGRTQQYEIWQGAPMTNKPSWFWGLKPGQVPGGAEQQQVTDARLRVECSRLDTSTVSVRFVINAGIPAPSTIIKALAPNIDADILVLLRQVPGEPAEFSLEGSHDGFPAYELYVNGHLAYKFDPVAMGTSPLNLFPPMDQTVPTKWSRVESHA